MITVAIFDILPTDDMYPEVFTQLPEDVDPYSEKFDRLDFGSPFIVMNLGTLFIIFLAYLLLYLVYPITVLLGKFNIFCSKRAKCIEKMIFWNHVIVFLQEAFLEIMISSILNFIYIRDAEAPWENWNLIFTNVVAFILTTAISVLVLFTIFCLWPAKLKYLRNMKSKARFGQIYSMVRVRRSQHSMLFPIIFFLRRIILAVAVIVLIDYPTF